MDIIITNFFAILPTNFLIGIMSYFFAYLVFVALLDIINNI